MIISSIQFVDFQSADNTSYINSKNLTIHDFNESPFDTPTGSLVFSSNKYYLHLDANSVLQYIVKKIINCHVTE